MEQPVELQPQDPADKLELTFRAGVDLALVFGGVPALVLNVLFWAVATAFAAAGPLPTVMALLVTLLLALAGIVLIVRYVDVAVSNFRKQDEDTGGLAAAACVFLAVCIVGCLVTAGTLDWWHIVLMVAEVLLVGYQTWRVFAGR